MEESEAMVNHIEPIDCRHVVFQISNFIEGEVDVELRLRMEEHFRVCAHCLAIYDGTRNIIRLVGDGQTFDVPAGFSSRLYVKLQERLKK
jgi:hypothetical protein